MKRRVRSGFSLMEVMLATSILLASSIVLIELATIGRKQAGNAYDLNIAQLLCQAKVDEIVAGIAPATSVEEAEMEDDPDWLYSVEIVPLIDRNVNALKVTVIQITDENRKPIRFSLVRWLPNRPEEKIGAMPAEPTSPSSSSSRVPGAQPREPRQPRGSSRETIP